MRRIDWNSVEEVSRFERLVPDGYICRIRGVKDFEDKEYLKVEYDIADGPFKGYYGERYDRFHMEYWPGNFIRSYKEKALPFFKQFKTALEDSNRGYRFDEDNLDALAGKYIGLVLGEEEYQKRNGETGTRLYVAQCIDAKKVRSGDYEVPDKKFLKPDTAVSKFEAVEDDDGELPF